MARQATARAGLERQPLDTQEATSLPPTTTDPAPVCNLVSEARVIAAGAAWDKVIEPLSYCSYTCERTQADSPGGPGST